MKKYCARDGEEETKKTFVDSSNNFKTLGNYLKPCHQNIVHLSVHLLLLCKKCDLFFCLCDLKCW